MTKLSCFAIAALLCGLSLIVGWPSPVGASSHELKTIEIRTVPPLPGVRVELDGTVVTTDAEGLASFQTADFRNSADRLIVLDKQVPLATGDGHHEFSRTFGRSLNIVLGFDLYREVSFEFETISGRTLGLDDIDSLQLKNTLGGLFDDVDRSAPVLLHANRVVSSPTGPTIRDVVWSVDSVMVGSSNVVNRSEVRFFPATDTEVLIKALFFDASFTVGDLFFGFPTGESVLVEDPSGGLTEYPLENGRLELTDLPRGEYEVTVIGPGLKLSRPVALSRHQEVDLALLSYLDLTVFGIGLLLFVVGTFMLGFRYRRRRLRALHAAEQSDSAASSEHDETIISDQEIPTHQPVANQGRITVTDPRSWADCQDGDALVVIHGFDTATEIVTFARQDDEWTPVDAQFHPVVRNVPALDVTRLGPALEAAAARSTTTIFALAGSFADDPRVIGWMKGVVGGHRVEILADPADVDDRYTHAGGDSNPTENSQRPALLRFLAEVEAAAYELGEPNIPGASDRTDRRDELRPTPAGSPGPGS